MNHTPANPEAHPATTFVAAAAAAVISVSLLGSVTSLFLSAGTPFAQTWSAEPACAGQALVSERPDCAGMFAASRNPGVTGR
jgi:hypothetical protein